MSALSRADNLTPKQSRFVECYLGLARGNATEAARLAGYKGNDVTLATVGAENLRKPQIEAAVAERLKAALTALGADEILAELSRIALGTDSSTRVADRLRALELLGRYHGLFKDRIEHTGGFTFAALAGMAREKD